MEFNSPHPPPGARPHPDWTTGPAKFILVAVLGLICGTGLAWSILRDSTPASPSREGGLAAGGSATHGATALPRTPESGMVDAPLERKYEEFAGGSAMAEAQPTETNRVAAPAAPGADHALLNLNTATQAEIELLPGIGPALAGRIIEQRQKLGAFKSLADLDAVSGIGPKMLEKIRPLVRFQ